MRLTGMIAAVALCAAAPALAEEGKTASAAEKHNEDVAKDVAGAWTISPAKETQSVTAHSITVGGKTLKYHATAGTVTIVDDDAKPAASLFYVAYTLDGAEAKNRPVTFLYNGGPGSSTLWLHMGSFAPMRVKTGAAEFIKPPPYDFGPNPDTLLDKSDLVFIDMVGAGYSRPLGDEPGSKFWGVDEDASAFAKAITRWTDKNERWTSPKFIMGESYGTLRSGALAYRLQESGMALNGVILVSSILNYGVDQSGYDQNYISLLPSYAATAWYHNKLANRPATIEPFLSEVRAFTLGAYAQALAKGTDLPAEERDRVAAQLAAYTGLSADFYKNSNLRVDLDRFQKELLRGERLTVGRLDSRYTGVDPDAGGSSPSTDPSYDAIKSAFVATFKDYVKRDLDFKIDLPYRVSIYDLKGFDWNWKHQAPGEGGQNNANVGVDLSAAMRANPYLKVLSLNGYYDMATPFFATEFDVKHIKLDAPLNKNVTLKYYESGHMIYLNPDALRQLHTDLAAFYDDTLMKR